VSGDQEAKQDMKRGKLKKYTLRIAILVIVPAVCVLIGIGELHFAKKEIESLRPTSGTITHVGTKKHVYEDPDSYREQVLYTPEVRFRYEIQEKQYGSGVYANDRVIRSMEKGKAAIPAHKYDVGESYPAWYAPERPELAVLNRGTPWHYPKISILMFLVYLMILLKAGRLFTS
jgi:hypothetical protein